MLDTHLTPDEKAVLEAIRQGANSYSDVEKRLGRSWDESRIRIATSGLYEKGYLLPCNGCFQLSPRVFVQKGEIMELSDLVLAALLPLGLQETRLVSTIQVWLHNNHYTEYSDEELVVAALQLQHQELIEVSWVDHDTRIISLTRPHGMPAEDAQCKLTLGGRLVAREVAKKLQAPSALD